MLRTERRSLLLFAAGIIVAYAGWQVGPGSIPAPTTNVGRGQLVFPDLAARLADVRRIAIESAGKTIVLLPRTDGSWGLEDRGRYPVQTDKLRAMLTGLTLIRQVEPRTADRALYGKIGVENAGAAGGSSTQVTLFGAKGGVIASLIVGHKRVRAAGGLPDELYIRHPGHKQSWLAQGSADGGALSVDADPQLWLDRSIVDIGRDRIAGVTSTQGGTTLDFAPKDGKLELTSPTDHPKLDTYKLDDVYGALTGLTLEDVAPATAEAGTPAGTSVFRTTDGLSLTVHLFRDGKNLWAQFQAAGKGAAPLEAKLRGWTYRIGSWMQAQLAPSLADLKATPPTGTAPTGTAPTGTAPTGAAPTGTAPSGTAPASPAAAPPAAAAPPPPTSPAPTSPAPTSAAPTSPATPAPTTGK